jgi:YgiT-type zinc finger domain-containing protein
MSIPEQEPKSTFPCNACQAGVMRLQLLTYFTWLDDEMVMVPNFPAWVCDVCGKREYDERAVNWLTTLLSPNAGKTTLNQKTPRRVQAARRGHSRPPSTE